MDPLVVVDAQLGDVGPGVRDVLVPRRVVGVGHPARFLRVVGVGAREVAGRPALYVVADVVLRGDNDGDRQQYGAGDTVVQPVDEVVVGVVA